MGRGFRVIKKTTLIMVCMVIYIAIAIGVLWSLAQLVLFVNNKILHWGGIGIAFWVTLLVLLFCSLLIAISEE